MTFLNKVTEIIKDAAGHPADWTRYDHALIDAAREADDEIEYLRKREAELLREVQTINPLRR